MSRKALSFFVLSALGLLPVGNLLCELSCAVESRPGQTAQAHHCQSSGPAAATIESADSCGNHAIGEQPPALIQTSIQIAPGAVPDASTIVEPAARVLRVLTPPRSAVHSLPFPPGFSILRI